MSRRIAERLEDVQAAVEATRDHAARGKITEGLVFDAVRVRLIEIGEAIKDLPAELLATEPDFPWQDIARMRDRPLRRHLARDCRCHGRQRPATARGCRRSVDQASRLILTGLSS